MDYFLFYFFKVFQQVHLIKNVYCHYELLYQEQSTHCLRIFPNHLKYLFVTNIPSFFFLMICEGSRRIIFRSFFCFLVTLVVLQNCKITSLKFYSRLDTIQRWNTKSASISMVNIFQILIKVTILTKLLLVFVTCLQMTSLPTNIKKMLFLFHGGDV